MKIRNFLTSSLIFKQALVIKKTQLWSFENFVKTERIFNWYKLFFKIKVVNEKRSQKCIWNKLDGGVSITKNNCIRGCLFNQSLTKMKKKILSVTKAIWNRESKPKKCMSNKCTPYTKKLYFKLNLFYKKNYFTSEMTWF